MIGVIISTLALFVVLSAFSGLISFNEMFINVADPDVKIMPVKGKSFTLNETILNLLKSNQISAFSKVIEEHALIENNDKRAVITIKGVDDNFIKVNRIDTTLFVGEWFSEKEKNAVVIGLSVANKIKTLPNSYGENLKIYVPKPGKGQLNINSFNKIRTQTIGVFRVTPEMDSKYVFAPFNLVKDLLRYPKNQISAIEIKLNPNIDAYYFAKKLNKNLGEKFQVKTRRQLNESTYKMLNMEHLFSYLIATLIGIIAFFNVIGAIIMMILDKRNNLKTLFNLGLDIKNIKKIFFYQGVLLTFYGMIIGLILAIIFVLLQKQFGFIKINPTVAYPVVFKWSNVMVVIATISILGIIASFIASSRVTKKMITN
jgi:lipoprotein-releasing system permease protein